MHGDERWKKNNPVREINDVYLNGLAAANLVVGCAPFFSQDDRPESRVDKPSGNPDKRGTNHTICMVLYFFEHLLETMVLP